MAPRNLDDASVVSEATSVVESALIDAGKQPSCAPGNVIVYVDGNVEMRIAVKNDDPYAYQRETRSFYARQGRAFPSYLPKEPTE